MGRRASPHTLARRPAVPLTRSRERKTTEPTASIENAATPDGRSAGLLQPYSAVEDPRTPALVRLVVKHGVLHLMANGSEHALQAAHALTPLPL